MNLNKYYQTNLNNYSHLMLINYHLMLTNYSHLNLIDNYYQVN